MKKYMSKALKQMRKSRKCSQTKLAGVLGMSRSKISSWEVGRRELSINDAILLCDYYNICLDSLLCPDRINHEKVVDIIQKYLEKNNYADDERERVIQEIEKILIKQKCLF